MNRMPIPSRVTGRDERAALLPPALRAAFDDTFVRSCDLIEEYTSRLAIGIVATLGIDTACADGATVETVIARAGLAPKVARVPVGWLLAFLAERGRLVRDGDRYRMAEPSAPADPAEIVTAQREHDASALPSYRIAELAASHYPAVLRAEATGEAALFDAQSLAAWGDYFSNGNPLYAINNRVAALALDAALPRDGARILEIGGGLGSAAEAALDQIAARRGLGSIATYRFTEIAPQFLRRAKKSILARHPHAPVEFGWLDIDQPPDPAAVPPGQWDAVFGVNVLHVAHDLAVTLGRMREALAPGGVLVLGECIRPFAAQPIYVELVFNLLGAFRAPVLHPVWRPAGGFLTPEAWRAALEANGFVDVRITPDVMQLRDHYPGFVVGAITARRS